MAVRRLPNDPKRWTADKTRRFTLFFVVFLLCFSVGTTLFIQYGRSNATLQAKLQGMTQELLPSVRSQEWQARQGYREVVQKLLAYIDYETVDKAIPGLSIALAEGSDIVWARGYGKANVTSGVLTTPETIWRVASVTKLFTATGIMLLVQEGKLGLDDPISKYVPELQFNNPFNTPITIRHLLSHRSGMVREPALGSYFDPDSPSLEKSVQSLNGSTIWFKPGTQTKYSNAAVMVLGYLLQKVSGKPYPDFIKERVLMPLEMKASSIKMEPNLKPRMATGYMWTYDGKMSKAPNFIMGIDPAAGLNTTMPDLCRFMHMLFRSGQLPNGKAFISKDLLESMWQAQFTEDKTGFGLGFYVADFDGFKRVQHSGVQYGIATRFAAIPELQLGVAAAGNIDNANSVIDRIVNYATKLMIAKKQGKPLPDFPKTSPISEAQGRAALGFYQNEETGGIAELRWYKNNLWMHNGTHFMQVKQNGKGEWLVDDRLGYGTRLKQVGDKMEIDGKAYAKIDRPSNAIPERWKAYLGEYGWDHNILFIYPRNGRLTARIEWFDDYALNEEGADHFAFPPDGLYQDEKVVFERDGSGKVTGVRAAGILFKRRNQLTAPYLQDGYKAQNEANDVFYIEPLKPREEIKALALAAQPPTESGKLPMDLVEIQRLDPTIKLDIRYASERNFMRMRFYDQPRAFLQGPAAEALVRAHQKLKPKGYGLLIHDAYRPWYVTKMFWEATPEAQKKFVANPASGSRHNRGCAVDLTLYDLRTGQAVEMPSLYDEFSERAYVAYMGGTEAQNANRATLRAALLAENFEPNESEWWHFDYKDWRSYPIGNLRFEGIR